MERGGLLIFRQSLLWTVDSNFSLDYMSENIFFSFFLLFFSISPRMMAVERCRRKREREEDKVRFVRPEVEWKPFPFEPLLSIENNVHRVKVICNMLTTLTLWNEPASAFNFVQINSIDYLIYSKWEGVNRLVSLGVEVILIVLLENNQTKFQLSIAYNKYRLIKIFMKNRDTKDFFFDQSTNQ